MYHLLLCSARRHPHTPIDNACLTLSTSSLRPVFCRKTKEERRCQ